MDYIYFAMKGIAQAYKNVDFERVINNFHEQLQDLRGCL
jgi:cyclophilin family peptidyl-prolyl cis-trans isomerase